MLDLQRTDRESEDGGGREVRRREDVGDIAVDEDVARLEAQEGRLRAAGVGAAEPEDLRGLALGQRGEEVRVGLGDLLTPGLVGL